MGFFAELKRRNVIRVAGVYIVVGWILVQVATALEESLDLPAWFDGTIVALLLIGLPIAVIFAWAFELTPEGVVKTTSVSEGESITSETGRKLDYTLAFAVVVLAAVIIWQQLSAPEQTVVVDSGAVVENSSAATGPAEASVAVLPFADMSSEGDQGYFSDGLSEEILNLLVRADAIEVVSRTSSFQFKNSNLGIPDIAAELNVRHIVEGSVRKSGETVRVTAQLIDAVSDRHLWSNTYDRPLTAENLFEIQDDVANSIFVALSEELGLISDIQIRAKRKTDDLDAYALFLKARTLYQARRDLDVVDELLSQAVAMDPEFSEAWEYKAGNQVLMNDYGYTDTPVVELHRRGLEFADKAILLDPESPTAIAAIANIHTDELTRSMRHHRWADILALYTKALEIDPRNASALNWRGLAYSWVGDMDAALADFEQCRRYEPYYVPCVENLHWYLADAGRDEEAFDVLRETMNAGVSKVLYAHLGLLARTGNELLFKAATNNVLALRDWRRHDELYTAFRNRGADHSELAASIAEFYEANPERSPEFMTPTLMALGYFPDAMSPIGIWGETGTKIRGSSHFKDVIKRLGILQHWQDTRFPPICRPLGGDDFECD